ncbi:nucleoside recognition domain-containing protein [Ohtaekwangia koreensis]|uniref:Spore maturation protein SpmA n=1 Tax=Ohtaekwangia koreensis TaxID=688867 RepID=A0A1T5M5K3_9BACT|nr:nucleoside recognition domain-containing protein [Ohtaekwangia koreensis]SKC83098.1 Spore maturation protein SpmA [Ohtaekwangia koreensis]
MVLNYIWVSFFLIAFVVSLVKLIFLQDVEVFPQMLQSTFDMAKTGFEISIALTGVMSLWLGLMKIGERGGIVPILSKIVGPFFSRLFPEVPKDHPATGSIIMNFSANILGLDNAATPLGLKAMKELQELNPNKDTASNAQIMFLVLNTSGLTVIPLAIIADRATLGAANPTSIFIPTLIATFCSTIVGLIYISIKQKINLFEPVVLAYLVGLSAFIWLGVSYFASLSQEELQQQSSLFTSVIIISIIISFLLLGLKRRIPLFETFVEGAKEGFETSIKIIPFLIAILVGIGLFRTSGALNYIIQGIAWGFTQMNINSDFVGALPVAFLKPLSGQAARGMMIEISKTTPGGPDSFVANLAAIFRGCAETTFYILAVYFGSVNVRKTRYALTGGLVADVAGIIAAIFVGYMFFY